MDYNPMYTADLARQRQADLHSAAAHYRLVASAKAAATHKSRTDRWYRAVRTVRIVRPVSPRPVTSARIAVGELTA